MPDRRRFAAHPTGRLPIAAAAIATALLICRPAVAQDEAALPPPPDATALPADDGLRYGSDGEDVAFTLLPDDKGGFAIGGYLSVGPDASPAWWMQFDADGLPTGTRLLPSDGEAAVYWLSPLAGGDAIALGDAESETGFAAAAWRLSPSGDVRWSAIVEDVPGHASAVAAVEVPGGDIVVAVGSYDEDDNPAALAIRVTAEGQEVWRRPLSDIDEVAGLILRSDGSLLAAGNRYTDSGTDIRLVALAQNGDSSLHTTLPTDGRMQAIRAAGLADGGAVMTLTMSDADDAAAAVLRLAPGGEIRWLRPVAASSSALDDARPVTLADGSRGIAVAGSVTGANADLDAFAGLLSDDGDWRWARRFAGPGDSHLYAIAQRPDGSLIAAGEAFVPRPAGAPAGAPEADDENWDAWLMRLSLAGEPSPLTTPVADPALAAVAEELRLASRQPVPGTPDLSGTPSPYVGPLGPPGFRQDGTDLEMALPPYMAGPILLNASRSRLRMDDGSGRMPATTAWANPVVQIADEDGIAVATVARQRVDWGYLPGTFLSDRQSMALEEIRIETPDGFRMSLASIAGEAVTEIRADGRFDTSGAYRVEGLAGSSAAADREDAADDAPVSVSGSHAVLETEIRGLDLATYAAALRSGDPMAGASLLNEADSMSGLFRSGPLQAAGPEDDGVLQFALEGLGIEVRMDRPSPSAPADIGLTYDLAGLLVRQDEDRLAEIGTARLALSGTALDIAGIQAAAGALDAGAEDAVQGAARGMLDAIGGLGLQLAGTGIAFSGEEGPSRIGRVDLALSADGFRDNEARIDLQLEGDALNAGRQPGMPMEAALLPQDLALTVRLGPLPVRDLATAVLAGQDDMLPMLVAQAGPMLEIPRLALLAEAGSIRGDGAFSVAPQSAAMLAGQMSLLVTGFQRLSELATKSIPDKGERAMAAGMGAYLAELGQAATDPDGQPALRFTIEAQPGGGITVNGEPFPPGETGGMGPGGADD